VSELNPYEKFLDGRPLKTILSATPGTIAVLLEKMDPAKVTAPPAPGKWSASEIVCHLADCELAFGFRLRQTLAEDNHVIQPFDQEKWAAPYRGIAVTQAQAAFAALRNWNLVLISRALPNDSAKPVTHPERGSMTFLDIVETMAGHDLNHLAQLRLIAGA
jgi:uncharacterized damage-inducible protein DinB